MKIWSSSLFAAILLASSSNGFGAQSAVSDDDGGAVVTFYRPKAFSGGGVKYDLSVSGSIVAQLKNCSSTTVRLQPGSYTVSTEARPSVSENPDPIEIETESGRHDFYLLDITGSMSFVPVGAIVTGTSSVSVGWRKSSESAAAPLMAKCTQVEPARSTGQS